ncbi:MAG: YceI family protein [Beijerinckiaceae bacterium]|jgi:polyisoprenoid-binding protein YceI
MIKTMLPLTLIAGLATMAPAAAQSLASNDPASVHPGTYSVDPGHTQVIFSVSHMGFSTYSGVFSGASGSLALDPANPAAATFRITIPIKSVLTTSTKLDGELKSPQWLDAAKFPSATFVSSQIVLDGQGKASVTGALTLHGVTKPVTLDVTFVGAGVNPLNKKYTVGFEASGDILRSDFGVKTYLPLIGDKLHLTIAGAFDKAE